MAAGLLLAAAGMALITRLEAGSSYAALLPALVLIGTGLGLLTPAVVSAAMSAVPGGRAGLASGVNNTARQAGGAIGVAAFGALAGSPAAPQRFLEGLHLDGVVGAALYLAAAAASLLLIRRETETA
jgi:DHA2 family methylenomycin A resistance protein-like MFS transporter